MKHEESCFFLKGVLTMYDVVRISVYLVTFLFSFYACGAIKYKELLHLEDGGRAVLFQVMFAIAIAYGVGSFLLALGGY